jgi:cation diffusion facilitator CzcD-associated flavoprotein CzcO
MSSKIPNSSIEQSSCVTDFDVETMREKYRIERDKRLRDDGNEQYLEVTGDYSHYIDDPYVESGFEREAVSSEVDVVLIGGGFGGLQTGARMREAGIKDICIIEKGGDFGGTWYWNRYPGAQCDVESYIYLPLLEELSYMPTQKYSQAPEILAHSRAIGEHYGLYEKALFQTEVTETRWDAAQSRWIVATNRGDNIRARFIAMANGPLNRPKLPGIPGINEYKGHTFHTSRWDYNYTGGDANGGLHRLHDKRVAIIGTGATAIQCVPHVGEAAQQLFLFQRTPSGVDTRDNASTDPEWAAKLQPGWQRQRMENFNALVSGLPQEEDLVDDGWTDLIGKMIRMYLAGAKGDERGRSLDEILEMANFEKMNEIRARAEQLVNDPATAESLKPYYKMFCKRPCFHDEYLQTFNRDNVTLVDTDGKGVERITQQGVVVNGVEYAVDCIIFATGFEVGTSYARRAGYEIIGRRGRSLTEKWSTGVRTLHGMQSREFPNCFILSQTQGGFTVNYPHMLDELAVHIAHIVAHALEQDIDTVEVTEQAEENWVQTILEKGTGGAALGGEGCTPGYYNNEGKPNPLFAQAAPYGGGPIPFFALLKQWREQGNFEGLDFNSR